MHISSCTEWSHFDISWSWYVCLSMTALLLQQSLYTPVYYRAIKAFDGTHGTLQYLHMLLIPYKGFYWSQMTTIATFHQTPGNVASRGECLQYEMLHGALYGTRRVSAAPEYQSPCLPCGILHINSSWGWQQTLLYTPITPNRYPGLLPGRASV